MTEPISAVLEQTGLTLDDMHEIVMVGGGNRIPRIQEDLKVCAVGWLAPSFFFIFL